MKGFCFSFSYFLIFLTQNLTFSLYLSLRTSSNLNKHPNFLCNPIQQLMERLIYIKSSLLCLHPPFLTITIILKPHRLSFHQQLLDKGVNCVPSWCNFLFSQIKCLSKSSTDNRHRPSSVLRGTESPELKFMPCISEGTCSVSVSILLKNTFLKERQFVL
jgi:hypothetical protein